MDVKTIVDMDVAMAGLPEWDDARIEAMLERSDALLARTHAGKR